MHELENLTTINTSLGRSGDYTAVAGRWTAERAQEWYHNLPWLCGTNYYPANAINQIEMWQAESFDIDTIRKEMQWAANLGMNTHRVYLHDLVWEADANGFYTRMDEYLDCCEALGIKPFFVFFDDCHYPTAKLGPQPLPVPRYHNSGWVTCPERATALRFFHGTASASEQQRLQGYVQGTLGHFADDKRVLMWELYNEPGRGGFEKAGDLEDERFGDHSRKLVQASWEWARAINPSQPICSNTHGGVGSINWSINFLNSDVFSIHNYSNAKAVERLIDQYETEKRPIFMTEYLARDQGSCIEEVLPVLKQRRVAAINWGFVAGKSGTIWNWQSRKREGIYQDPFALRDAGEVLQANDQAPEPDIWFHDLLRPDGTPYRESEAACFQACTRG